MGATPPVFAHTARGVNCDGAPWTCIDFAKYVARAHVDRVDQLGICDHAAAGFALVWIVESVGAVVGIGGIETVNHRSGAQSDSVHRRHGIVERGTIG